MKRHDEKIDHFRQVPWLRGLSARELADLARLVDVIELPAGAVLIEEGRQGYETMVIVDGQVEVTVGEDVVNKLGPGEIVGEMALVDRGPRSATVTALTPIEALVIGRQAFEAVAEKPSVAKAMRQGLVERLRGAQAWSE